MTEDEARKKWCPFARIHGGYASFNRSKIRLENIPQSLCIASDCMMWRWGDIKYEGPTGEGIQHGYCGLAGKP